MATAADQSKGKIDIGRVISRGFSAIGSQAVPFAAVSLILAGLPTFLTQYLLFAGIAAVDPAEPASAAALFSSPQYLLSWGVMIVAGYVLQAALARSTILHLSGRAPDLGRSIGIALRLLPRMIGLVILSILLIGIGLVLFIVPGVILYIMLIVSVPALVEERRGVVASMGRSRRLTKGSRWRIFTLILLFAIAYLSVSGAIGGIGAVLGSGSIMLMAAATSISAAATSLLVSVMLAALYLELRTAKEGASGDALAAIFE